VRRRASAAAQRGANEHGGRVVRREQRLDLAHQRTACHGSRDVISRTVLPWRSRDRSRGSPSSRPARTHLSNGRWMQNDFTSIRREAPSPFRRIPFRTAAFCLQACTQGELQRRPGLIRTARNDTNVDQLVDEHGRTQPTHSSSGAGPRGPRSHGIFRHEAAARRRATSVERSAHPRAGGVPVAPAPAAQVDRRLPRARRGRPSCLQDGCLRTFFPSGACPPWHAGSRDCPTRFSAQ
jgi:hypothetical protein